MHNESNILTDKRVGTLMLVSGFVMVFAMLHHPENAAESTAARWVHGVLMLLLVFNAFGVGRLVEFLKAGGRDTSLAMLFYYIGLGSMIAATLLSGFVQTSLPQFFSPDAEIYSELSKFSAILNQAFAKLGVVSFGAAGVFFLPALIIDKGVMRLVGIVGGMVGLALVVSMLAGLYLSVFSMTILTILIVLWHCLIAVWLIKH